MPHINYDIWRSPSGIPETEDNEFIGLVEASSADEALAIAGRKVACPPPALLWVDATAADSDLDMVRLDQLEDLPQAA